MTEWILTKKSVAGIGMLVTGDREGVLARRSTLVFPTIDADMAWNPAKGNVKITIIQVIVQQ